MSIIRFQVNGVDVECESPADAASIIRELTSQRRASERTDHVHAPAPSVGKPRRNGASGRRAGDERVLLFLQALKSANGEVQSDVLATALGLTEPRGLGSITSATNRRLKESSLRASQVYKARRGPNGRVWIGGKKIDEAIKLVEELLAAEAQPEGTS